MHDRAYTLGPARVLQTTAADGDVGRDAPRGEERRIALSGMAWTTVRQVHGAEVAVAGPDIGPTRFDADGIVTTEANVPIALFGADCALVALASPEGVIGVAHAGWRGLLAGVIQRVAESMRDLGATELLAAVGPMIHPECYAFGSKDLDAAAAVLGDQIRSVTAKGETALDLPKGVERALDESGVTTTLSLGGCTACESGWFSWRARSEVGRHALVIWRPER